MDDHHHHQIQLQIPNFVYSAAPTLIPGGGAEIVPAEWFANSTFSVPNYDTFQPEEHDPSSAPFDFSYSGPISFPAEAPDPPPDLSILSSLAAPSPMGLPVYSASGFDLLSIFARIANRPNPRVVLGPVDLTCSFVVVDVRRFDCPIVYCSPTFCRLTGYTEKEVLNRNCRFLQAPNGHVQKGEPRRYTSQEAVAHLRKSLVADKECQTSIVNYKKNGAAFINLVTVIPIPGEDNEIVYHVGFQVDLTEQPNVILDKLRDGSYIINYAALGSTNDGPQRPPVVPQLLLPQNSLTQNGRDRKANSIPPINMSKELKRLVADPAFLHSFPIPTTGPATDEASSAVGSSNHILHLFLLEAAPDFVHVVSLKGNFLYVAPSVRRVLGYESEELIGKSISDYAHPEDIVPLERELKASSSTGLSSAVTAGVGGAIDGATALDPPLLASATTYTSNSGLPRSVDLLFRVKTKMGRFVWLECRGRLHVEPGKGRKAIVLTGRAREMMNLKWEDVRLAGGLTKTRRLLDETSTTELDQEVWGMLDGNGIETATFLSVGHGMPDVLGWTRDDLLGTGLMEIVHDKHARIIIDGFVRALRHYQQQRHLPVTHRHGPLDSSRIKKLRCFFRKRDGTLADVWFILYRADPDEQGEDRMPVDKARGAGMSISPAALVYQIRLAEAATVPCGPESEVQIKVPSPSPFSSSGSTSSAVPDVHPIPPSLDMFDELSISRGSSWQYELQQLRISNSRLEDQIRELEKAEVSAAAAAVAATTTTSGSNGKITRLQEKYSTEATPSPSTSPMTSNSYDPQYDSSLVDVLRLSQHLQSQPSSVLQPLPPPPPPSHSRLQQDLYSRQPLSLPYQSLEPQLFHSIPSPLDSSLSGPHVESYLHHPQPKMTLPDIARGLVTPTIAERRAATAAMKHQQQPDWGIMQLATPHPLSGSESPMGHSAGHQLLHRGSHSGGGLSLKRPWGAMDST